MTTQKRLMVNLHACREAYNDRSIDNVSWVRSENNVADGFTKFDRADLIQLVMKTESFSSIAHQSIVRSN